MSGGDDRPPIRCLGGPPSVFLAEGLVLPTGLIVAACLSRQLGPADYGLFALALSTVGAVEWVARELDVPARAWCLRILAVEIPITSLASASHEVLVARGRIRPRALSSAARGSARLAFILLLVGLGFGVPGARWSGERKRRSVKMRGR